MKVGLIGFGRTGCEVASVLLNDPSTSLEWVVRQSERHEHQSVADHLGIETDDPGTFHAADSLAAEALLSQDPVDVIIDFSSTTGLSYYATAAARRGVAVVTAISQYSAADQNVLTGLAHTCPVLWSPNITIGINFMLLAAKALQRMDPTADIEIIEEHFKSKIGVSGTALRLADGLHVDHESVHTIRAGGIIGVHEILFGLPAQTVRLRHETIAREAFGSGAIFAAHQILGRSPGMYRMEDLLVPFFNERHVDQPQPEHNRQHRRVASRLRLTARKLT